MSCMCEFCGRDNFPKLRAIGTHIRYCNKNLDHLNVEQYYNKFMKKREDEGICATCGNPTSFLSIELGYSTFCSDIKCSGAAKKGKPMGRVAKNDRIRNIEYTEKYECQLCHKELNGIVAMRNHIPYCKSNPEKLNSQQYYDRFIKKDSNEGICEHCGKHTDFNGLEKGYDKFCSWNCANTFHIPVKSINKTKEFKERLAKINLEIVGDPVMIKGNEIVKMRCVTCGFEFFDNVWEVCKLIKPCKQCEATNYSVSQQKFTDFISTIIKDKLIAKDTRRFIYPSEVDLLIPDEKISIEYNGLYWHSSLDSIVKDRIKAAKCIAKGYKHIIIWEDEYSQYYNIDDKLVEDIITYALCCNFSEYLKNIEYFTTLDLTEQEINILKYKNMRNMGLSRKYSPDWKRPSRPQFIP